MVWKQIFKFYFQQKLTLDEKVKMPHHQLELQLGFVMAILPPLWPHNFST